MAPAEPAEPEEPAAEVARAMDDDVAAPEMAEAAAEPEEPAPPAAAVVAAAPTDDDAAPDDLKKIKGIGKAIEGKLAALGITRFAQIAGWDRADVERVDGELAFKGRIDREEWIAQARKLAEGE